MTQVEPYSPRRAHRRASGQQPGPPPADPRLSPGQPPPAQAHWPAPYGPPHQAHGPAPYGPPPPTHGPATYGPPAPHPGTRRGRYAEPDRPRGRHPAHPPAQYRGRPPERSRSRSGSRTRESSRRRRGSHATTYGQGFSWVLAWTIVGALIPGTGLITAGWRRLGGFLLLVLALAGAALAGLAVAGDPVARVLSLAVDPQKLLVLAVVTAGIAVAWVGVILLTNAQLRRYAKLSSPQRLFTSLVVTALVVGVGLPAYEVSHDALIQRDLVNSVFTSSGGDEAGSGPQSQAADPWANKPRENVLLIGSDAGADRTGVRPDTLILASIDTRTGDTVLFSLPRNLERAPFVQGSGGAQAWPNGFYCPTVGTGHDCLLNAIWQWAETDGRSYYPNVKRPGLAATEDAVEGITGLHVDTYTMLNLKGFAEFIDAIGGLRVNVTQRLPIGGSSEHPVATHGYIEKGNNQQLNGFKTLWYARSRWSTNDYDRMRRQRCVIGAVIDQADPVKLARAFPSIAKAAKHNLSTGIPKDDLQAWVELTQKVKKATVRSLPFTDQVVSDRSNPDYAQIRELVAAALKPVATPTPAPSASATSAGSAKKAKVVDPSKAQNIADVC